MESAFITRSRYEAMSAVEDNDLLVQKLKGAAADFRAPALRRLLQRCEKFDVVAHGA